MNWLFSIIYLIIIFLIYGLLGNVVLEFFGYDNIGNEKKVISGFILVFFLGFVIGVPCQLLHTSWNTFKFIFLIVLLGLIILAFFIKKNEIMENLSNLKKEPLKLLKNNLKNYWFLYLLVIAFAILSVCNLLSYYRMNYDDSYYIGKIVNQVGSNALLSENYYNGNLSDVIDGGITRVLNTFEISYGFFATIFNISIPFFCRVAMTVHNYILTFLCYKAVGELFVKKKNSQYILIPFTILLISSGFLMNSDHAEFTVRMYDGWQFQTAIFYGSSVVRVMAIPILIIFGIELVKKLTIKKVVFMGMIYLTMMSFSTIFTTYAVLLTFAFILIKALYCFKLYYQLNNKKMFIAILSIIIMAILLIISKKLDNLAIINTENYNNNVTEYYNFYAYYFGSDTFVYYAPFFITGLYFISKNYYQKSTVLLIGIPFLIIYSNKFVELMILSTFNYFFVALRFITSIQLMIVSFVGIAIVIILEKIRRSNVVIPVVSCMMIFGVLGYIYMNKEYIYEQDFLGSGMTKLGYSFEPLIKNDEMIPQIMVDVGNYFDSLQYGNYSLVLPNEILYNDTTIPSAGFVITSNRVELCSHNGCNSTTSEEIDMMNKFFSNEIPYTSIDHILKEHQIEYVLVTEENQKDELKAFGFKVVLSQSGTNRYYLLKTTY